MIAPLARGRKHHMAPVAKTQTYRRADDLSASSSPLTRGNLIDITADAEKIGFRCCVLMDGDVYARIMSHPDANVPVTFPAGTFENHVQWALRGFLCRLRHADRENPGVIVDTCGAPNGGRPLFPIKAQFSYELNGARVIRISFLRSTERYRLSDFIDIEAAQKVVPTCAEFTVQKSISGPAREVEEATEDYIFDRLERGMPPRILAENLGLSLSTIQRANMRAEMRALRTQKSMEVAA